MASRWEHGASSSSSHGWKYDVFLSFSGEDTRKTFVGHLYKALCEKGSKTFKDDKEIRKGREIGPELREAIEESMCAIIIFSENYASSTWCLNELVEIIDCEEEKKIQKVVPVFYHVEPSEVRHQKRSFETALVNRERDFGKEAENVQTRRNALKRAADLSGHTITPNKDESECIENIVREILSDLDRIVAMDFEHLVGIESRAEKVISLLSTSSIIVIWGLGGIGKTTIAEIVFEKISDQFEGSSFLKDVREVSKLNGVQHLQKKLLYDILGWNVERDINVHEGIKMIKNRLRNKKVLVILDNVDHFDQINYLAEKKDWLGLGSRIIITTRDKHLFPMGAILYEVSLLNEDEAIQLFSMNAFKLHYPREEYEKLSYDVVHYAGGLPLALKVFGAFLFGRDMTEWGSALDRLREIPEDAILAKLRISYDGLRDVEKEIFLDIACFFKGKRKDSIIGMLDNFDLHPKVGISVLIEKCFIIESDGCLSMHDLIQEMGQLIVRNRFPKEPEKWSRLWCLEDVQHVLAEKMGPKEVEAIVLDLYRPEELNFDAEAFKEMNRLRMLKFRNIVTPSRGVEYLPNKLRWLEWDRYPSKSLPQSFDANGLRGLIMCRSGIKRLWKGKKQLRNLKVINLSGSYELRRIPDFSGVPNLETLILTSCENLVEVHPSIGVLKKLRLLDLRYCKKLKSLPSSIQLPSLENLSLSGCSKLEKFPEIHGNMERLSDLLLDETGIKDLPSSIQHLTNLSSIRLVCCKNLRILSSAICAWKQVRELDVYGCSRLCKLPDNVGDMKWLERLNASHTALKELPSSIKHLTGLVYINLGNCNSLTSLPETICHLKCLETLLLTGCSKLDNLPENLGDVGSLEELYADGTAITIPPPSIGRLKNLKVLLFGRCERKEDHSVNYFYPSPILSKKRQDSVGLVLPSLSCLSLLTELDLSDCNMFGALPSDIGDLSSLEELNLGGNNFVNLPESINRLSRLEILRLVRCKNLKALPRLPSNIVELNADECPSLKDVPDLSMNDKLVAVSFMNCFKQLQNNQSENMAEILLQRMLQALLNYRDYNHRRCGYGIFLPGIEIPQCFIHQNPGHSITIHLQSGWCCKNLTGIALCIVGESTTLGGIMVSFIFRDPNGWCTRTLIVFRRRIPNKKINFAHMFLTCLSIEELDWKCYFRRSGQSGSRLEVFVENKEEFQVKKIGIHLLYQGDTDGDNTDWFGEPCKTCMKSSDDCSVEDMHDHWFDDNIRWRRGSPRRMDYHMDRRVISYDIIDGDLDDWTDDDIIWTDIIDEDARSSLSSHHSFLTQ